MTWLFQSSRFFATIIFTSTQKLQRMSLAPYTAGKNITEIKNLPTEIHQIWKTGKWSDRPGNFLEPASFMHTFKLMQNPALLQKFLALAPSFCTLAWDFSLWNVWVRSESRTGWASIKYLKTPRRKTLPTSPTYTWDQPINSKLQLNNTEDDILLA